MWVELVGFSNLAIAFFPGIWAQEEELFGRNISMITNRYFPLTTRCVDNPTWLAPEILLQKPYHTAADVYSFGVILYEISTRKRYFGEERFFSEIERRVVVGERPDILHRHKSPHTSVT